MRSKMRKEKARVEGITYTTRGFRLLPMHFPEHFLQLGFERLVFCALVELAHEATTSLEGIARKGQGGHAKVL